ncbi:sulfatase-like hydrolase/transferase [Devosia algicola]|uniref:Sulfatase-like hydrolase/transferase n=1 Tax=Devosia algicola TaxID=3026418 RepID=A0ABY7YJ78_9HYPH|nr:sulfatase-like hydrolase/transferase [Devosia algicola]WDR01358.1 sulfatase-like hydrolase/transferase [Devosia algicola]
MAKAGQFLRHSYTCQPVCGPARSAFQTGKYPTTTGCFRNGIPLPKESRTLAHHFSDAGYDTAYIGKWHLADNEPVPKSERGGYKHWLAANILEFTSWAYDAVAYDDNNDQIKLPGYRVDALTDAAIRYVAQQHGSPFFMFLSFLEPHHQNQNDDYPAPIGYEERIRRTMTLPPDLAALGGTSQAHFPGYMGMVQRLDEAFGRLVDALHSLDMLDNTIILFSADHGCHFKTRNSEYKRSCHDASIRVPSLLHGPGFSGKGEFDGMVSLIDLPPTLLDAAGLPIPEEMQGRSLLNASLWDERHDQDVFVQISEDHVGRALRTSQWKYEVGVPGMDGNLHPNSQRYVETHLYDLVADPYELNNLVSVPDFAPRRAELRARLLDRIDRAEQQRPEIVPGEA